MKNTEPKGVPPRGLTITMEDLLSRHGEFSSQWSDDGQRIDALINKCKLNAQRCRHCGSTDIQRKPGSTKLKCKTCKITTYIFAETFFAGMRKPHAYITGIWLREQGIGISSNKFAALVDISQSGAYEILKKLDTVTFETFSCGASDVSSSLFWEVFSKRSSETQARKHPNSEQEEVEKQFNSTNPDSDEDPSEAAASEAKEPSTPNASSIWNEIQQAVFNALSDVPISFESLCSLTGLSAGEVSTALGLLEMAQRIFTLDADRVVRAAQSICCSVASSITRELKAAFDEFIDYIRHVCHGISRKHLQKFLAAFWCFKKTWTEGSLFEACGKSGYISSADIRNYVTPPNVKVLSV